MAFNDAQQLAVDSYERATAVLAGAGSGKTSVLVERYFKLLERGVRPHEIFVATFTVDAAEEMRHRVLRRIQNSDLSPKRQQQLTQELLGTPYFGTLHSFCFRIFTQWGTLLAPAPFREILTDYRFAEVFDASFLEWQSKLTPEDFRLLLNHLSARNLKALLFDFYPHRRIVATQLEFPEPLKPLAQLIGNFWTDLQNSLWQLGIYSFDDLEQFTVRLLLEREDVFKEVTSRLKFFFIDEFQDTSPTQWQWIQRLTAHRLSGLFIVGDPKQSIYRFRQADYRVFFDACQTIESAGGHVVELQHNYRSHPLLLKRLNHFATDLFSNSTMDFTAMEAGRLDDCLSPSNTGVDLLSFEDSGETLVDPEISTVVAKVRHLIAEGVEPKEIAILSRASDKIPALFDSLTEAGIPAAAKGISSFSRSYMIQDITAFLYACVNPLDDFRLSQFLLSPFIGWTPEKLFLLKTKLGKNDKASLFSLVSQETSLRWWVLLLEDGVTDTFSLLEALFSHTNFFPAAGGLLIEWLNALLVEPIDAETALNKIESWQRHDIRVKGQGLEKGGNAVQLLTVHGSKGLEFNHVFIVDNKRQSPKWQPLVLLGKNRCALKLEQDDEPLYVGPYEELLLEKQEEEHEELKRLLYVAATRAKEKLYVTIPQATSRTSKNPWWDGIQLFGDGKAQLS